MNGLSERLRQDASGLSEGASASYSAKSPEELTPASNLWALKIHQHYISDLEIP